MKTIPDGATPLTRFSAASAEVLLRRFAFEVHRTLKGSDPEAIHDLRVSVRRLDQCLETFEKLFPAGEAARVARRTSRVRKLAGSLRNLDIAAEYFKKASAPAALRSRLSARRRIEAQQLREHLKKLARKESWRKWKARLV